MKKLVIIGIAVLFIGLFLIILSFLSDSENSKFAVGGIIGFIPFGLANDKNLLWFVFGMSFLVFLSWLMLYWVR